MEDLAQTTVNPRGRTVTRQELFDELKNLEEEISHLKTNVRQKSLRRKRRGWQNSIDPPVGYASYQDYRLHCVIDLAFNYDTQHGMTGMASWHDRYFHRVDLLRLKRDQLRTYVARRTGNPDGRRTQDLDQWERLAGGDPPPHAVGLIRQWARGRFEDGMTYEQTLREVANQVMMYSGEQLDRRRADAVKKAVDREYGNFAPMPPRGWWRPGLDAGSLTPGGLKKFVLAWQPAREHFLILHWDPPPQSGDHPWFGERRVS